MDNKTQIKNCFYELNTAYLKIIEHNIRAIYYWKPQSYRQSIMDAIEPCCDGKQLDLLYNLYTGFIITYQLHSMEDKIALTSAILFMYYNMVLIETHDNELLSTSIPRDSSGKKLASNFLTIKHVFVNCIQMDLSEAKIPRIDLNDLDREHVYNKFVEFYTNILISDDIAYGTIRRFFLGPTFSERRHCRSRTASK